MEQQEAPKIKKNHFKHDYSFRESFYGYSFLKKFLIIVLFPLVPIYTVSKGFQTRKWNKTGSDRPPSLIKYVLVMLLVYFFTVYPLSIAAGYIVLQIYLFPLSLIITYYLHRKKPDIVVEPSMGITSSEEFQLNGFKKKSWTYIGLLIFSLIVGNYFFIFTLTALPFILFPNLYRKIYFIPKRLLVLSYSFLGFISIIPGVNLQGTWFIEPDSEIKRLQSSLDVLKFIFANWKPFFIINVGISAIIVRIILLLRGDPPIDSLLSIEALTSVGFLLVFWIVPLLMIPYFVWTWVWEDAELKVAQTKISTAGRDEKGDRIVETTLLTYASESISNVFTLAFGIPSIGWLVEKMVTTDELTKGGWAGLAIVLLMFFVFSGATTIFLGVMYYRSGMHEELVNRLRNEIKEVNSREDEVSVRVCYSSVRPIHLIQKE